MHIEGVTEMKENEMLKKGHGSDPSASSKSPKSGAYGSTGSTDD